MCHVHNEAGNRILVISRLKYTLPGGLKCYQSRIIDLVEDHCEHHYCESQV